MIKSLAVVLGISLFLAGCGGGEGRGEKSPPPKDPENASPTLSLALPVFIPNPLASGSYQPLPSFRPVLSFEKKIEQARHERATYYYDLGSFYNEKKEDPRNALSALLKAVDFEPHFTAAHLKIAQILLLWRYYSAAYDHIQAALLENPRNEEILLTREAIKMEFAHARTRAKQLERELRQNPNDENLKREIAELEIQFLPRVKALRHFNVRLPVEMYEDLEKALNMEEIYRDQKPPEPPPSEKEPATPPPSTEKKPSSPGH